MVTKGYASPEVERAYSRARELCREVEETSELFSALWGLRHFYSNRSELETSRQLGEQLVDLAQRQGDRDRLLLAQQGLGHPLLMMGEFGPARQCFEHGMVLYNPVEHRALALRYGVCPGVQCITLAATALWFLGYPEQALHRMYEGVAQAHELDHPHSLAHALYWSARLHAYRLEAPKAYRQVELLLTLAAEYGFEFWLRQGRFTRGWALAAQGQSEEGLAIMDRAVAEVIAGGSTTIRAQFPVFLAEAYGKLGQSDKALALLTEAQAAIDASETRMFESEVYRIKAEVLLQQPKPDEQQAVTCFSHSLDISRRQQAKSLELRAATSLARHWQKQGKREEVQELLAPVYGWFTEGFDTVDLQNAKQVLEELRK